MKHVIFPGDGMADYPIPEPMENPVESGSGRAPPWIAPRAKGHTGTVPYHLSAYMMTGSQSIDTFLDAEDADVRGTR
jgi:hypothetical protein